MADELSSLHLSNFIIGDSIILFESNNEKFYAESEPEDQNYELFDFKDFTYNYFMKNSSNIINKRYVLDDYRTLLKTELSSNLSVDSSENYSVFYDKDLNFLISGLFVEANDKIYTFANDVFDIKDDVYIKNKYVLGTYPGAENDVEDTVKERITSFYNGNTEFYEKTSNINDKSIPVYDINDDALKDLYLIKFQSSTEVDKLVLKINTKLAQINTKFDLNLSLDNIKEKFLYDSENDELSIESYDSIVIEPIYEYIYENLKENVSIDWKTFLKEVFTEIFSRIPLKSYARFLNPLGKLTTLSTQKNSSNSDFEMESTKSTNNNEYVYSFDLKDLKEDSFSNENLSFNYFSLKNLKNPEDYHDYILKDINENLSNNFCFFDYTENNKSKIISYFDEAINELSNYIETKRIEAVSSQFIIDNDLSALMTQYGLSYFQNWTEDLVSATILSDEENWLRLFTFKTLCKNVYNIEDINKLSYLFFKEEYLQKVSGIIVEFKEDYSKYFDETTKETYNEIISYLYGFENLLKNLEYSCNEYVKVYVDETKDKKYSYDEETLSALPGSYEVLTRQVVEGGSFKYKVISRACETCTLHDFYDSCGKCKTHKFENVKLCDDCINANLEENKCVNCDVYKYIDDLPLSSLTNFMTNICTIIKSSDELNEDEIISEIEDLKEQIFISGFVPRINTAKSHMFLFDENQKEKIENFNNKEILILVDYLNSFEQNLLEEIKNFAANINFDDTSDENVELISEKISAFIEDNLKIANIFNTYIKEVRYKCATYANNRNCKNFSYTPLFLNNEIDTVREYIKSRRNLELYKDHNNFSKYEMKKILNNSINNISSESAKVDFLSKLKNYYTVFDDQFSHENYMKKDGIILGKRKYNYISKSNCLDKLWVSYSYSTAFDQDFFNTYVKTFPQKLISKNEIYTYTKNFKGNNLVESKDLLSGNTVYCIDENDENFLYVENDENSVKKVKAYLKMLDEISQYEFLDVIEGEHKYKESNLKKSNVYSLELKNSNLNYTLYSYNDIITKFKNKYNFSYFDKTSHTFNKLSNAFGVYNEKLYSINGSDLIHLLTDEEQSELSSLQSKNTKEANNSISNEEYLKESWFYVRENYGLTKSEEIKYNNGTVGWKGKLFYLSNSKLIQVVLDDKLSESWSFVNDSYGIYSGVLYYLKYGSAYEVYSSETEWTYANDSYGLSNNVLFKLNERNAEKVEIDEKIKWISRTYAISKSGILYNLKSLKQVIIKDEEKQNCWTRISDFYGIFNGRLFYLDGDEALEVTSNDDYKSDRWIYVDGIFALNKDDRDDVKGLYYLNCNESIRISSQTNWYMLEGNYGICDGKLYHLSNKELDVSTDIIESNETSLPYWYSITNEAISFENALKMMKFEKIFDITKNKNSDILEKIAESQDVIPYDLYDYYDTTKEENIKLKMNVRKILEETIRNSVDKYMPVNTTLWKIKYSGL